MMKRMLLKRPPRECGQALVETALSMLIILVLLAGMVDFGIAFGYRVALDNASRGGARFASRYPTMDNLIRTAVVEALTNTIVPVAGYDPLLSDPDLVITITCENAGTPISCSTVQRGNQVRVTVGYTYHTLFASLLGVYEVPISSSTIMYVLGPDQLGG